MNCKIEKLVVDITIELLHTLVERAACNNMILQWEILCLREVAVVVGLVVVGLGANDESKGLLSP